MFKIPKDHRDRAIIDIDQSLSYACNKSFNELDAKRVDERIKNLNLELLIIPPAADFGSFRTPASDLEYMTKGLSTEYVKREAQLLGKKKLFYKSKDFIQAIEYFEIFSLYIAQKEAKSANENKNVLKALKYAEEAIDLLKINKIDKKVVKPHVKELLHSIRKIQIDLDPAQAAHFQKSLAKAAKILKKI